MRLTGTMPAQVGPKQFRVLSSCLPKPVSRQSERQTIDSVVLLGVDAELYSTKVLKLVRSEYRIDL